MITMYFVECEWDIGLNSPFHGSRGCYLSEGEALEAVAAGYDFMATDTIEDAIEFGFVNIIPVPVK